MGQQSQIKKFRREFPKYNPDLPPLTEKQAKRAADLVQKKLIKKLSKLKDK